MGFAPGVADVDLLDQIWKLGHLLAEEGVYFFHRLVAAVESFVQDLRVAEVATAVLVYLHMEAARRQAIVEIAIADYGEIASCCGHFFGVEFLGQPVALGPVAEVDAHYQRVVLLRYWILAASCLGVDRGGCSGGAATPPRDGVVVFSVRILLHNLRFSAS